VRAEVELSSVSAKHHLPWLRGYFAPVFFAFRRARADALPARLARSRLAAAVIRAAAVPPDDRKH